MGAQHTPGPWIAIETHDKRADGYIRVAEPVDGERRIAVAQATRTHWSYDQFRANARLISAAPELLKALKELSFRAEENGMNTDDARDAIAKAEGRS